MSDVMIPNWTLGDRLAKAREVAGYERIDMARELGVTERTVWNYEHDTTTPRLGALRVWADLCTVPLWWLLDQESPGDATSDGEWYPPPLTLFDLVA